MHTILLLTWMLFQSSIYNYQFTTTDGTTVSMESFRGKKILLVNIATGSQRMPQQMAALQQLYQQYDDSLVVIGFPSNSFGHETRSNAEIGQFCRSTYGITFPLAASNPVAGAGIQPIYNWLARITENGAMNGVVGADFQKFMIDKDGALMGIFSPSVLPSDPSIIKAITGQ